MPKTLGELKDELRDEDQQTQAVTQYLVQVSTQLYDAIEVEVDGDTELEYVPITAWIELGRYEVPSGARRKAIELAMQEHKLDGGTFHTIPESSAATETCRAKMTISWE